MKRGVLLLLALCCLSSSGLAAQKETEYAGKLDKELVADRTAVGTRLKTANPEQVAKLPAPLQEGDLAFAGNVLGSAKVPGPLLVLVEPKTGSPFVYADLDRNGSLAATERSSFSPVADDPTSAGEMILKFALKDSAFPYYPLRARHSKPDEKSIQAGTRFLALSFDSYARGTVEVDKRKILVQYSIDAETGVLNPSKGYQGVDGNADGKIDMGFTSPEAAYATDETIVFRAGDRYVSTKIADPKTGQLVLRDHPAADYIRIDLAVGSEIPDFSFTDFDGKARKLSDFRGKYLLLDFWGTWCGPCVGEIPHLKDAYAKYKSRGFEILGMDQDKEIDKVKAFLAEKGVTWTQATTESINVLLEKRFRITAYPTTILLDPKGKIVSLGRKEMRLRGPELLDSLEKVLPAAATQ